MPNVLSATFCACALTASFALGGMSGGLNRSLTTCVRGEAASLSYAAARDCRYSCRERGGRWRGVELVGGVAVPAQPSGCVLVGVSLGASGAIGGGQHTASQQTSASGRPSLSQGGAGYIMGVLESWWELGGWAMAEFYRELRERPGLQFDLCFMGRTEPLASRSSFTPLHWERKSHASCLHGVAPAPIGVPPACGSAAAVGEVWNNDDGDQIMMASQVSDGLLGGCIPSGTAYSAHAEVMRYMPGSPNSAVANRTRGRAARRPVVEAQAAAPGGGGAQADLGDRAAGAAATAEAAAVEMAQFQAMLESVDAAFEPAGAAGPTHEYLDDDDAAYADALYYWGPVAEARRRAAWEVHIRDEMADAHVCITERECCICFESLGDDSSCGAVCRLACGGGTHLFHMLRASAGGGRRRARSAARSAGQTTLALRRGPSCGRRCRRMWRFRHRRPGRRRTHRRRQRGMLCRQRRGTTISTVRAHAAPLPPAGAHAWLRHPLARVASPHRVHGVLRRGSRGHDGRDRCWPAGAL